MDDDFEALLRQHVKARKVGSFPKQPPFFGPLRAIVKTAPQAEVAAGPAMTDDGADFSRGGFARKRPAPEPPTYGGLSLLERVGLLEREISDLRSTVQTQAGRILSLERLVGAPPLEEDDPSLEVIESSAPDADVSL